MTELELDTLPKQKAARGAVVYCLTTKVKNYRIKFQIFHFTFTSLDFTLSLPDFTLRYLFHCNPDN